MWNNNALDIGGYTDWRAANSLTALGIQIDSVESV
jgi:hypothetical protein